jgi:hypothetical protein
MVAFPKSRLRGFQDNLGPRASAAANSRIPPRINPWGLAAVTLATLALLFASLIGWWWLTLSLSALGLAAVLVGLVALREAGRVRDRVWLSFGGVLSGAVLSLALLAPGVLNGVWEIDFSVPGRDPDQLLVVSRDQPEEGKPLGEGEGAEASTDAIRQGDLLLRVQAVQVGRLPEQEASPSPAKHLLIRLRLNNLGHERTISFEGFSNGKHRPIITNDRGRSLAFRDQRHRKRARGAVVFESAARPRTVPLGPTRRVDVLLVFAAPASESERLKLELPAAAWGGKGVCRFRITRLFAATSPNLDQK